MDQGVQIFLSYAHHDRRFAKELLTYLSFLQRQGIATAWSTDDILAGQSREQAIHDHLNTAEIILFLVSPNFLASEEYNYEASQAMGRSKLGKARIIPIVLRPFDKNATPFAQLPFLPKSGKPVARWANRELAYLEITEEIMRAIADFDLQAKGQGEEVNLQKVLETFSARDLRALRFDLGLPPGTFPKNTNDAGIPELLLYMKDQGRMQELAKYIRRRRPNFS